MTFSRDSTLIFPPKFLTKTAIGGSPGLRCDMCVAKRLLSALKMAGSTSGWRELYLSRGSIPSLCSTSSYNRVWRSKTSHISTSDSGLRQLAYFVVGADIPLRGGFMAVYELSPASVWSTFVELKIVPTQRCSGGCQGSAGFSMLCSSISPSMRSSTLVWENTLRSSTSPLSYIVIVPQSSVRSRHHGSE